MSQNTTCFHLHLRLWWSRQSVEKNLNRFIQFWIQPKKRKAVEHSCKYSCSVIRDSLLCYQTSKCQEPRILKYEVRMGMNNLITTQVVLESVLDLYLLPTQGWESSPQNGRTRPVGRGSCASCAVRDRNRDIILPSERNWGCIGFENHRVWISMYRTKRSVYIPQQTVHFQ